MRLYKKIPLIAALLTSITSGSLSAAPMFSIGDTADVFLTSTLTGRYMSNVFNSFDKHDDFALIFSPGAEITIGRESNANMIIRFREDIYWYNRFASQNTQNANVFVDGFYETGPLMLSSGFSFVELEQNTPDYANLKETEGRLVKRDIYRAYLAGDYDVSEKTFLESEFEWVRTDYTNNSDFSNSLSDYDEYVAPIDFFYRYSPKLAMGLGYRFRYTDASDTNTGAPGEVANGNPGDFLDNFVSFALQGELLPKLEANMNIGYQNRSFNAQGMSNENTFSMLSNFTYYATPKATIFAGFNRDLGISGTGLSTENTGGNIGSTYAFDDMFAMTANFEMVNTDYQGSGGDGRSDDTIRANTSVTYTPNIYLQLTAEYGYINNSSNLDNASFMGHSVNLSASVRY